MGSSIGAPTGVDSAIFTVLGLTVDQMLRWVVYIELMRGAPNYICWRHYFWDGKGYLGGPTIWDSGLRLLMTLAPWIGIQ